MAASLLIAVCAAVFFVFEQTAADDEPEMIIGYVSTRSEDLLGDEMEEALLEQISRENVRLISVRADCSQSSQIEAFRVLLTSSVDVIVFSPVVQTGWESVLRESWKQRIPVVTFYRDLNAGGLCAHYHVGYDYGEQAKDVMAWLENTRKTATNVFFLSGTMGSSVTDEIKAGLRSYETEDIRLKNSASGNYMRSRGREIAHGVFSYNNEIDVIASCNSAMAAGTLEALQQLGIPERDVRLCVFNVSEQDMVLAKNPYVDLCLPVKADELAMRVTDTILHADSADKLETRIVVPYTIVQGQSL